MAGKKDSIPARLQAQLLALGVPAAKHTSDGLATFFPREFNITAAGLDTEDLAKVLIHFVEHEIVAAPSASLGTSLKRVEPGWHFCRFYRDTDQLLNLVAPYMAEGLKNGEACLWVTPASVTSEAACAAIAPFLKDVDRYLDNGQLEIRTHPTWYLNALGQLKSFEEVSEALLLKQDQALTRGFKFLRAAGDAGWVSGSEQSRGFIEYEMKINAALQATKVAAMCTFRADVTADEIVAIVTAHQDALYTRARRPSAGVSVD